MLISHVHDPVLFDYYIRTCIPWGALSAVYCDVGVKGFIRDIEPDAYTKPKLSASTTEAKEAKKARREETVRRKAVQEEMSLIAMRVFENLLARESAENTIDGSSQFERASCDVPVDSD